MLEIALIISVTVVFLHASTWEGMILQSIPVFFWNVPVWIKKPLFSCPVCMTLWWGPSILATGIVSFHCPVTSSGQMAMLVLSAAGINVVLTSLIKSEPDAYRDPGSDFE